MTAHRSCLARGSRRLTLGLVVVVVMVAGLSLTACGSSSSGRSASVAPDFSGVTLDGQQVSLSGYLGRPLVVVFMASWCGPCREESPEIDQFYQENKDRAALIAVAVDDSDQDIRGFMNDNGLTFPLMLDDNGAASAYGVNAIPTTVVIDAEGHIVKRVVGGTTAAKLTLVIDGLAR